MKGKGKHQTCFALFPCGFIFVMCVLFVPGCGGGGNNPLTSTATTTTTKKVTQVSAGNTHTCALTSSGGAKCWGTGFGALGNNSTTSSRVPVDVFGLTIGVLYISAGSNHTCAVTTSGGVKCWGLNVDGQLGNGTNTGPESCVLKPCSRTPVDVVGLTSGVSSVSGGSSHTCVVTTSGSVKCWGNNNDGQLGNNSTTSSSIPVDVSGLTSGVLSISAGMAHTCAVTTSGGLKCWGYNYNGQLGNENTTNSSVPVDVSGLTSGVISVSSGGGHTCAVTASGGAKCWGNGYSGQLGNNGTTASSIPVDVSGLTSSVSAVSAGDSHTCAVTTSGGVKCWGANYDGQLGNNSTINSNVPVDVVGLSSGVSSVSAGYSHTCAITSSGSVKCWGWNNSSQLGNNSTTTPNSPVDVDSSLYARSPLTRFFFFARLLLSDLFSV